MNITDQRSFNLNRDQREEYIAGYSLMIRKNRFGRVPHYINFMFNHVPGNRKTKMEFMKKQVIRVHDILNFRSAGLSRPEKTKLGRLEAVEADIGWMSRSAGLEKREKRQRANPQSDCK